MARYVAATALNLTFRGHPIAHVEHVASGRLVRPIEPGEVFEVPDELANAFEAQMGPQPGNGNVSPESAAHGRIRGLQRIP